MSYKLEDLIGTSGVYDEQIAADLGIDPADLEDRAADAEICRCAECGWWVELGETQEREGESVCEDCRS